MSTVNEIQRTLVILKPDALESKVAGKIIQELEAKTNIVAMRMLTLSKQLAQEFYIVHKDKPFYQNIASYMSRGPIIVMVLEGNNVIREIRTLIGVTDPKKASPATIRAKYGSSLECNVIHASDSTTAASYEIPFFFNALEMTRV